MKNVWMFFGLACIVQQIIISSDNSSPGITILKSKKASKETFAFVNKEKTTLAVHNVNSINKNTLNERIMSLHEKIDCNTIINLRITSSLIESLAGINRLFPRVESLTIQNNVINNLDINNIKGISNILITNNTVSQLVVKELIQLKNTLGECFIEGSNMVKENQK